MKEEEKSMKSGLQDWDIILLYYMHSSSLLETCLGLVTEQIYSTVTELETSRLGSKAFQINLWSKRTSCSTTSRADLLAKRGFIFSSHSDQAEGDRQRERMYWLPASKQCQQLQGTPGNVHSYVQLCFHRELPTVFLPWTSVMHYRKIHILGKAKIHRQNTLQF